jgi:glycosyltransferase involved in cell wall biosynthesis
MLLDAVARARLHQPIDLRIVGEGPMRQEWEEYAAAVGLGENAAFLGSLPLDEVAREMQGAHLLCLPSVRESGGAVLLEAMATARPVVAVAFGGPAEIVDDAVGRAIPPRGRERVTAELTDVLLDVARHPGAWRRRGEEARQVALRRFTWDAKIEETLRLYRELIARRAESEHFRAVDDASAVETRA